MRNFTLAAGLILGAVACNSADTQTDIMCGPNGECPGGYTCDTKTRLCVRTGAGGLDTILSEKPGQVSGATVQFAFTATDGDATYECSLDSAAFSSCTTPLMLSNLTDGSHTFAVRAVSGGQRDTTPASYSWTVSSVAPVTTITEKPQALTNSTAARFVFSAAPPGSTTECALDGATPSACASPVSLSSLAPGEHRFTVRATSPTGTKEANPPTVVWTVDTTGPTVTISEPKSGATTGATVRVVFSSDESVTRFECAADSGAFTTCGSGRSGMTDLAFGSGGAHTASVQGVDAAGNVGPKVTVSFTVDASGPTTTIEARAGNCASEPLSFSAGETATFTCAIDAAAAAACTSPFQLPGGLAEGTHSFTVVATDARGNSGPAQRALFIIDRTGPTVTIAGTDPAADARGFSDASGTISFHSDGSAVVYACALDGAAPSDCSPSPFADSAGLAYAGLKEAQNPHHLVVTATDACANAGLPAALSFKVDTTGPTITVSSVTSPDDTGDVSVKLDANEPLAGVACALDGLDCSCTAVAGSCSGAAAGEHIFTARGTDAHGNLGTVATSSPFTVRYGPNAGHAILIGHDWLEASAETDGLLRNAFEQVPYRLRGLYQRGLRIAVLRGPGVATAEADRALGAVSDLVDVSAVDEIAGAAELAPALRGKDLLLVLDQQDPAGVDAIGQAWAGLLADFLDAGGVAVVLDGLDAAGEPSRTYAVLSSVLAVTASASFGPIGSPDLPARRFDDANDALNPDTITPLSVGTSYLTLPSTVVFGDQDPEGPRWPYVRVTTICSLACFTTIVPVVIDKIFPVYGFATGLPDVVGPSALVPFELTPATVHDHIACTVTNLQCNQWGNAPPCLCGGGAESCACEGDEASGFRLPFVTAGTYRVDLRMIDPYGSPGRSARSNVEIDLPTVTLTPSSIPTDTYNGVICYRGTTVDGRALSYALTFNSYGVPTDQVKSASCAPEDAGSFVFYAACNNVNGQPPTNIFRVDATDAWGNTSYTYVSWYRGCIF